MFKDILFLFTIYNYIEYMFVMRRNSLKYIFLTTQFICIISLLTIS